MIRDPTPRIEVYYIAKYSTILYTMIRDPTPRIEVYYIAKYSTIYTMN